MRVVQGEIATPFPVAAPCTAVARDAATSSFRVSFSQPKDKADGDGQALPAGGLSFELAPSLAGQAIVFGFATGVRLFPFAAQEAAIFEAMQRRVEGALWDLNDIA